MTAIIFFDRTIHDTQAPRLQLRLQIGRASVGQTEYFLLGNGTHRVLIDGDIAADFMDSMMRMALRVRKGVLDDWDGFSGELSDSDGGHLGVDFGIKCGGAYLSIENSRVDVSLEDLHYINAACGSVRHLARRRRRPSPALRVARQPQGPQPGMGTARLLDPTPLGQAWYDS